MNHPVLAPLLGSPAPEVLTRFLGELIRNRRPEGHLAALKLTLGLVFARGCGIRDGMADPFPGKPRAHHLLERRVDELDASSMLTAEDWNAQHAIGVEIGASGLNAQPDRAAATALSLERHAMEEGRALSLILIAAGIDEAEADLSSAATVVTGIAIAVDGNAQKWAGMLAKGNQRAFSDARPSAAESGRAQQAGCLKRYMRLRNIDDVEAATEDARAISRGVRIALMEGADLMQESFRA